MCLTTLYRLQHPLGYLVPSIHVWRFGDASGESAIIEPLTVLRKKGQYQLATNYFQSNSGPDTCPRYRTAVEMFNNADAISVELFREILDAVHQDEGSPTVYSNIYDLKQRIIYLYHFHDYDHVVVLNLDEELAQGEHSYDLQSLFPENEAADRWTQPILEELERQWEERVTADVDPKVYEAYVGMYEVPAEIGIPHAFNSVTSDDDKLNLQVKIDKGWYQLPPQSETSFFHLSHFNDFSVTFLPDESGQFNQFLYDAGGGSYTFTRLNTATPSTIATPVVPTPTIAKLAATPSLPAVTPVELNPESQPVQAERVSAWLWWFVPVSALAVWIGVRRWVSTRSSQSTTDKTSEE